MKIEELREIVKDRVTGGILHLRTIKPLSRHIDALLDVAEAAGDLVGPNNIGKTVDTTIKWEGAISSIFTGESLHRLVMALEKLEAIK